jgi:hypothetical protein
MTEDSESATGYSTNQSLKVRFHSGVPTDTRHIETNPQKEWQQKWKLINQMEMATLMKACTLVNCKQMGVGLKLNSYVLGHDAMKRMANSNVLIVGMKGLGVEIGL